MAKTSEVPPGLTPWMFHFT